MQMPYESLNGAALTVCRLTFFNSTDQICHILSKGVKIIVTLG